MRPRSGKEYQNIDRSTIVLVQPPAPQCKSVSPVSSISSTNINYVNITPVPESSESPSPGYQSSSSLQEELPLIKVWRKFVVWSLDHLIIFVFPSRTLKSSPTMVAKLASTTYFSNQKSSP